MEYLISVIIPNYNHAAFLGDRIKSVINQKHQNIELIILDDCSSDNSKDVIASFGNSERIVHVIFNKENSGSPFKQWQKGIELAKGDWIWIAESDDFSSPEFLSKLTRYIDDETAFVYCNSHIIDQENNIAGNTSNWLSDLSTTKWAKDYEQEGIQNFLQFHRYKNIVSNTSSVIFRKELVSKIDIFPSDFKICGDWLFFAQLSLFGKVKYVAEPLNYWRQHPATTRNAHSFDYERLRIIENIKIVKYFNHVSQSLKCKTQWEKYHWIVAYWLNRYSYKNLFKTDYVFVPLPNKLKLLFFQKLFFRTINEIYSSLKTKISI